MLSLIAVFFSVCIVVAFKFINAQFKPPIIGIYQRKNKFYWIKFIFMFISLSLKQLLSYVKLRIAIELGKSDDGTIEVPKEDLALEETRDLGTLPLAVDGVYFNATSKAGAALVCGVARRQNGICESFMYFRTDGNEELYLSPKLPDSTLEQKENQRGTFCVDGIAVKKLVPMRSWSVEYNGKMKARTNPEKEVDVNISLTWGTKFPPFNYNKISALSMARDLARETWSSDYFKMLKKYHQDHYEQMGDLIGTATIDGKEHVINMPCVRDHSFSKHRDWRNFHRYVYHFIYLENGDGIAVGAACQPLIMSHLTIGYYCRASDQSVKPIHTSDFKLYQHGEHQQLPKDYGFSFTVGLEDYFVQVFVQDEDIFYIGKEREAKFYERWCQFQVNGIKGWGCSEWHYNNQQKGKAE